MDEMEEASEVNELNEDSFVIEIISEKNKPSIKQYIRAFLALSFTLKLKFLMKFLIGRNL